MDFAVTQDDVSWSSRQQKRRFSFHTQRILWPSAFLAGAHSDVTLSSPARSPLSHDHFFAFRLWRPKTSTHHSVEKAVFLAKWRIFISFARQQKTFRTDLNSGSCTLSQTSYFSTAAFFGPEQNIMGSVGVESTKKLKVIVLRKASWWSGGRMFMFCIKKNYL